MPDLIESPTLPPILNMTLRDFFAAHALAGLLASDADYSERRGWAINAYAFADLMIEARGHSEAP